MLTLIHAPQSRSIRALWLLEETGLAYDMRYVEIDHGPFATGKRDPQNVHPDGKVPVIIHDGVRISESYAITLYLTDLAPESGLGAPIFTKERGTYLEWLMWSVAELEPVIFARVFGGGTDPRSERTYGEVVSRIESALAKGDYLMGDRFTAVDVMVGGNMAWARHVFPESAAIDAYIERIGSRPASQAAWAKDAPIAVAA